MVERGAWVLVRGVGKSFSKCLQSEKMDNLEMHKGALDCGKPSRPQEHGASLCLVSTWHGGVLFGCSGSVRGALPNGHMCVFGRPRLIGMGFKWAVGRWLRAATRLGPDSPDRRDDPDIADSRADRMDPRGPGKESRKTAKVCGRAMAL